MSLKDIPKHMRTKRWIESEIVHESYEGVRTVHNCKCGKYSCRSSMCVYCWRELLKELK
ncbi:MAG: hypothetical protein ACTSWK_17700 [Promethearchaeota archaeon]